MEVLWEKDSPCIGRDIIEELQKRYGWNRSTTLTLLRRMKVKGTVRTKDDERITKYYPLFDHEEAVITVTKHYLIHLSNPTGIHVPLLAVKTEAPGS